MDWLLADVTSLPHAQAGEEAVIMGGLGNEPITPDEIAALANTIPYEILCGMSRRIPRFYV
jgi:alanine racemase